MSTELTVIQRAVKALGYDAEREKALVELAGKSTDIKAITNKAGYEQVHAARIVLKNTRVEIQRLGKGAREDATKFSKAVIAEENRLISLIEPEETRLECMQTQWDADREAERVAAIAAEEQRVEALEERVVELRGNRMLSPTSGSNLIGQHIEDVERITVDDSFQEYRNQAEEAKAIGLAWLRELHAAAVAHEAEQARIKAEREDLEKQRAAQKKIDDAAKAERDAETARQNEALRKQKEAQDAEAKRLADIAADLARQQEALRKAQEPPPAPPPPPPAPVSRRGVAVPVPKAAEMIDVLAKHYRARPDTIIEWLRAIDWKQAEAA
jgi:hypothetical protein